MNDAWIEFIKQAPWAFGLIVVIYMFLRFIRETEEQRTVNAKEAETNRRAHEMQINAMWAANIKSLVDKQEETLRSVAQMMNDHEEASKARYEKLGITKDLIKAVKDKDR